jgi:hypothetical protein
MKTNPWRWWRVAGYAGIGFVVVFIPALIIQRTSPYVGDSIDEIRSYYIDDDALVHFGTFVSALAFVLFFLTFASGLRSYLAVADTSAAGMWSGLSFVGAILAVAVGGVGLTYGTVLSMGAAAEASDGTVRTLVQLDAVLFGSVMNWGLALFLFGAAMTIFQSEVLARWVGWLAVSSIVFMVIGSLWPVSGDDEGALANIGGLGSTLLLIWVLAASVTMIRTEDPSIGTLR